MPELKNFHIASLAHAVTLWFGIKFNKKGSRVYFHSFPPVNHGFITNSSTKF
jgi:hypothetical protein